MHVFNPSVDFCFILLRLSLKSEVNKHLRGNLFDGVHMQGFNACIPQLKDYLEIIAQYLLYASGVLKWIN